MVEIGEKIGGEEVEEKNKEDVKNKESVNKDKRDILIRTGCIMFAFVVVLSLLTACLVVRGTDEEDVFMDFIENSVDGYVSEPTMEIEYEKSLKADNGKDGNFEKLPTPLSLTGPEARNYVAYIPVPINDDEEDSDEEYYDEEYDDDDYYDDEDYEEDEYYEDEPPPKKKKTRKKNKPKISSTRRQGSNRRRYQSDTEEDKERVPFLVPLMMVPENQVGLNKEFSFSQDQIDDSEKGGIFSNVLNTNKLNNQNQIAQQPMRGMFNPPNRRFNNKFRNSQFQGPSGRPVHDVPGPPYRGPPPRNPNLPMDDTIIHPSIHRPRFRRPPQNFRPRFYNRPPPMSTSTTPVPTTTTTKATTTEVVSTPKPRPNIIVVQQPGYNPYQPQPYGYNPYQQQYGFQRPGYQQPYYPQQPLYQMHYPSPTPTTTTTTTTTTTSTMTTTKRTKRKKKKKKPAKPLYTNSLTDEQLHSLSYDQLTIVNNQLVPLSRQQQQQQQQKHQQQSMISNRLGLAAAASTRRFSPQYKVRGRKRFPNPGRVSQPVPPGRRGHNTNSLHSSQSQPTSQHGQRPQQNYNMQGNYDRHMGRYESLRPTDRRFDMPNIFSQSGFEYEHEERPIINRPPPRHPGVKVPGVRVPPNAGNIEDIISPKPIKNDIDRYTTHDGKYTINNNYRPPVGENQNRFKPTGSYEYPNQSPVNYRPQYDPPPYRPQQENSYNQSPPSNYNPPKPPTPYSPPPPPYSHPFQNYNQPQSHYNPPSQQKPPPYSPPSQNYNQPPQTYVTIRTPTPQKNHETQRPSPPSPISYNPPPPQRPVVPPAYNQDYYITTDPESQYPGPEIYDGGNIHGPPTVVLNDKIDNTQGNTEPHKYNSHAQNYNSQVYLPATLVPPTRRPPSIYNKLKPTLAYDKRPIYNNNNGQTINQKPTPPPTYNPQPPSDSYPSNNKPNQRPYQPPDQMYDYSYNSVDKIDQNIHHSDGPDYSTGTLIHPDGPDYSTGTLNHPDGPDYSTGTLIHPDGPDYSTGTLIHPPGSKGSAPFKVGLDLYPIEGVSPLGAFGKQDIYGSSRPSSYSQDDNKHQILLHLNLFSKKPSMLGGRQTQDTDSESFSMHGRKEAPLSNSKNKKGVHLEIPTLPKDIKDHPIFGNLNPFDILKHLLRQSLTKKQKEPDLAISRTQYVHNDAVRHNNEVRDSSQHKTVTKSQTKGKSRNPFAKETIQNIPENVHKEELDYDYDYADTNTTIEEEVENEEDKDVKPEYYYYYYYDYLDSGIDISHELPNGETNSYEPLPTPLWQVSDAGNNTDTMHTNDINNNDDNCTSSENCNNFDDSIENFSEEKPGETNSKDTIKIDYMKEKKQPLVERK